MHYKVQGRLITLAAHSTGGFLIKFVVIIRLFKPRLSGDIRDGFEFILTCDRMVEPFPQILKVQYQKGENLSYI